MQFVIVTAAVIGLIVAVAIWLGVTRSGIRRQDFEALKGERNLARTRARVVNKYLVRTKGQVDLVLSHMSAENRIQTTADDRLLLQSLRDQLATLETEEGHDI